MKIVIIIPILAKEDHIKLVADEHLAALRPWAVNGKSFELIMAVNGDPSVKGPDVIRSISPDYKEIRMEKRGWGLAMNAATNNSESELVCYTNASYVDAKDLVGVLDKALENPTKLTKVRRMIRESKFRKVQSVVYNFQKWLLLGITTPDLNAAPKIYPRSLVADLKLPDDGLFDAALLYYARKKHVEVVEIPILWGKRKGGKSNTNWKTVLQLALGLFPLAIKIRLGEYHK